MQTNIQQRTHAEKETGESRANAHSFKQKCNGLLFTIYTKISPKSTNYSSAKQLPKYHHQKALNTVQYEIRKEGQAGRNIITQRYPSDDWRAAYTAASRGLQRKAKLNTILTPQKKAVYISSRGETIASYCQELVKPPRGQTRTQLIT